MIRLSYEDLWNFLDATGPNDATTYAEYMAQIVDIEGDEDAAPPLDPDEYAAIKKAVADNELVVICQGQEMSCDRPGGDDILSYIDETVRVAKLGLEIVTWYGPQTQALAFGVKPGLLDLFEGEPDLDPRQDAMDGVDAK